MRLKISLFTVLAALSIHAYAQFSIVTLKSKEFLKFKASKTYVLKTGNKYFDDPMAAALNEYWKITPFDFVDDNQIKEKIRDKNASFILPFTISHYQNPYN